MLCCNVTAVDLAFLLKKKKQNNSCFFFPPAAETISKTVVDGYLTTEGVACLYLMLSVTIYFNILQRGGSICL